MKTKAVIAGAVVLAVLLLMAMFLLFHRSPPQAVTARHVKSVQSSNVTTMTFEVTNHTANTYILERFDVEVRNGDAWTRFPSFSVIYRINPSRGELSYELAVSNSRIKHMPEIAPRGVASYALSVTNLPDKSVVRFSAATQKVLLGVEGFVARAERKRKGATGMPLNPFDRKSRVFGNPTEIVSVEWIESVR